MAATLTLTPPIWAALLLPWSIQASSPLPCQHSPEGVTPPRGSRKDVELHLPTPETVGILLKAADAWFNAFLALAALGGLRLGEISGLKVGDVDFMKRQILVRRQVRRAPRAVATNSVTVTPPKHGSTRAVPAPDGLLALLSVYIRDSTPGAEKTDWLSITPHGNPPHQNTVGYWFRKTKRAASVVEGVTLHDLCHFFASGLIASGCDVVTVQRALGHAKASTTLTIYGHLWPTGEERTRGTLDPLMRDTAEAATDSSPTPAAS